MTNPERRNFFQKYLNATSAAREAYRASITKNDAAQREAESERYANDPLNAIQQDRRGWTIGVGLSAGLTAFGTAGTIFLSEVGTPQGAVGFGFLTIVGLGGTIYSGVGRRKTTRWLEHYRNTPPQPPENKTDSGVKGDQ